MLFTVEGRQRSLSELDKILSAVGLRDIEVLATFGYYSLVSAIK